MFNNVPDSGKPPHEHGTLGEQVQRSRSHYPMGENFFFYFFFFFNYVGLVKLGFRLEDSI